MKKVINYTDYITFDFFEIPVDEALIKYATPQLLSLQISLAPYDYESLCILEDVLSYYVELELFELACVLRDEINYRKRTFRYDF